MAANNPGTGQPSSWSRDANAQTDTNDFSGEKPGTRTRPVELVQQKATAVTDRLADGAQSTFEQAKGRVAEQVRTVANVMEKATGQLRESNQPGLAEHAERFTRKVERASDYLQRRSAREMTDDFEQFTRRNPAWMLAGAFVLGLIGARFLKSSERRGPGTERGRHG